MWNELWFSVEIYLLAGWKKWWSDWMYKCVFCVNILQKLNMVHEVKAAEKNKFFSASTTVNLVWKIN